MDAYKTFFIWITILCLIQDYGSCSDIIDGPKNVTVLTGSNASFLCTVGSGWKTVSWYLKGVFIVTISPDGTTVAADFTITVKNSTNSVTGAFTSEITLVNVNKTNSGTVQCSSLSTSSQDAYLSVQVSGSVEITNGNITVTPNSTVSMICQAAQWYPAPSITWQMNNTLADTVYYSTIYTPEANDFVMAVSTFTIVPEADVSLTCLASISTLTQPQSATAYIAVREHVPATSSSLSQEVIILIAVFASLGGLLLLIVIIVVIVICCKRKNPKKTESGYQSDARTLSGSFPARGSAVISDGKPQESKNNNLWTIEGERLGEQNLAYAPDPVPVPVRQSFGSTVGSDSTYNDFSSTSSASSVQVPVPKRTPNRLTKIRHVTHV